MMLARETGANSEDPGVGVCKMIRSVSSKDSVGSHMLREETECRKTRKEVSSDLGPELDRGL